MSSWVLLLALTAVGLGVWLLHDGLVSPPSGARARRWAARDRLVDWLIQAGVEGVTLPTLVVVCTFGAIGGGLLAYVVLGWPVANVLGTIGGCLAYPMWLRGRHARRRAQVRQALLEAIERIRDGVGTGLDIGDSFQDLATNGPPVLRPYMQQLCAELKVGVPFAEALERLRDRLADPTFDLVAQALVLRDAVGGAAFGDCLARVANAVRAQISLRGRLAAARGRLYLSAQILALMPVALLAYIRWWSPTASAAYQTALGQTILAIAAVVLLVSYALTLWLARLPDDDRVLVRPL